MAKDGEEQTNGAHILTCPVIKQGPTGYREKWPDWPKNVV